MEAAQNLLGEAQNLQCEATRELLLQSAQNCRRVKKAPPVWPRVHVGVLSFRAPLEW